MNLRTKLIIVSLLISLIPLMLLGFFTFKYISGLLQEEISENELDRLSSLNNQFTYFLKDIEQMTLFFYNNEEIQEILKKDAERSVENKYEDYEYVSERFDMVRGVKDWDINIYVIGLNGDRYFSNDFLPSNYNDIRESWGIFRKAEEANGALVWDTNYSINKLHDQEIVLTAGRMLVDSTTDEKIGYLMVDIYESSFSNIYDKNHSINREHFFLVDDHGYIISSQPEKNNVGTKLETENNQWLKSGTSGFLKFDWENTSSILTYHTDEETSFKAISIIPMDVIQEKNFSIRNLTLNFALIGIIFSAWLAYFLSKTITKPLYKLIHLMKEVEKGNLEVRFDSKYKDDIGVFGQRFNHMLEELKILIQDNYEKQVRMKDSELKALRAQINPHFLYNTLETINWLARLEGVNDISKLVLSLSEIMKYSVKKGKDFVTIEQDVEQLKNYLTIQEFRYRDKFKVYMDVDASILKEQIPALLLQPLVENAIVHGMENKETMGIIRIIIKGNPSNIKIVVQDDGIGMNEDTLELVNSKIPDGLTLDKLGIGIENVRKRLYLSYGEQFSWNLSSKPNEGTSIEILIPYKEG
ncbi:HAMP domain-containing protein [Virgibacillus halodenitrificans]|uniref:sensor histidine kinase n=1 Tax=Virgibacillus halodenitrificans TaxID=1482 RepID=UPI00136A7806|nr:sensor histidine kinase [Virgibacillus halodenitrificans]MYL45161.1 HAMP domain-containing protein [Virgibacillus halodenitrificans]